MTNQWLRYQRTKQHPDAWIQTYPGGTPFWPLEPDIDLFALNDIAWHLSQLNRYNGGCARPYSVAEHSIRLCQQASPESKLWALLHDAHEAYIGDPVRPIKWALTGYKEIADRLDLAIGKWLDLPWPIPEEVNELDFRILADERDALHKPPPFEWATGEPLGIADEIRESPMTAFEAYDNFVRIFWDLRCPPPSA